MKEKPTPGEVAQLVNAVLKESGMNTVQAIAILETVKISITLQAIDLNEVLNRSQSEKSVTA